MSKVIIHEAFYRPAHLNNIALMVLEYDVPLSENVGLVCLPPPTISYNTPCRIAGWGQNNATISNFQPQLKKANVNIVSHERCQSRMRHTKLGSDFVLHESFVCAIGVHGEDTCNGDGGTPLICPIPGDGSRYYQLGITSWGMGCGNKDIPGKRNF